MMDGIHDLGGKQGYGKVEVEEIEVAFHTHYDGVGWTINQTTRAPGMSIDWWRHIRELTPPLDYLTRPYFDQWAMTQLIAMIDTGQISLDEFLSGNIQPLEKPIKKMTTHDVLVSTQQADARFNRQINAPPKYRIGDEVITRAYSVTGHTRLPGYAQGKSGIVVSHHGAHLFPDACAKGDERAEHLYTVRFNTEALWPEDMEKNIFVHIDLWESYFVN